MDLIIFKNWKDEKIEVRKVDRGKMASMYRIIPNDAVEFTYVHEDVKRTYVMGKVINDLNVVKLVNENLYQKFMEYGKNNDVNYVVCIVNNQVYFKCCSPDSIFISSFQEFQDGLDYELGLGKPAENIAKVK